MKTRIQNRREGYSLIEVVIALGIVAVGLVSILGTLSIVLGSDQDAEIRNKAAMIAESEFERIRALDASHFPTTKSLTEVYFSSDLENLGSRSTGRYVQSEAFLALSTELEEPGRYANLCQVKASIHYPWNPTATNRKTFTFYSQIRKP